MANKRIKMKGSWQAMARLWATYAPPAKPSPIEIRFFEQHLKKMLKENRNIKALVLGSTPEFRDLLAKYKVNTIVVDNNPVYVKAMAQLIKRRNPREKTIISDWLAISFKPNTFDLVLSDAAQDNIKYTEFNKFFGLMHKALKPTGYWFFAAICGRKENQISFSQYINIYRKKPARFKGFKNLTYHYFQLCFNQEFYNTKTKKFNFSAVDQAVKKLVDLGQLPVSALKHACFNLDYKQTTLTWEELKKIIKRRFVVSAEKRDRSHIVMKNKWAAILIPKR